MKCGRRQPWVRLVLERSTFPESQWVQAQRQRRRRNGVVTEKTCCKGLAQEREGESRGGKIGHRPRRVGERSRWEHGSYAGR